MKEDAKMQYYLDSVYYYQQGTGPSGLLQVWETAEVKGDGDGVWGRYEVLREGPTPGTPFGPTYTEEITLNLVTDPGDVGAVLIRQRHDGRGRSEILTVESMERVKADPARYGTA